jgi:hypothetical protein
MEGFTAVVGGGNVSLEIPSIHPCLGIGSRPAVNHQPEFEGTASRCTPTRRSSTGR